MGQGQSTPGQQGPAGPAGVGIKTATIDKTGLLTLTMTDGTTQTVQVPIPAGVPGTSIKSAAVTNGNLTLTMSDGTTLGPFAVAGPPGPSGIKSATIDSAGVLTLTMSDNTTQTVQVPRGPAGVGIQSAVLDTLGNLTLTMTDGSTQGPFAIKGPKGDQGIQGLQGPQGNPGQNAWVAPLAKTALGINFSNAYQGAFGPAAAEISNDTGTYKSLMILGNTAADGTHRAVSLWDNVDIHNNSHVFNNEQVDGSLNVNGNISGNLSTNTWTQPLQFNLALNPGACMDSGQFPTTGQYGCLNGNPYQQFKYNIVNGQILNIQSNKCLSAATSPWNWAACDANDPAQQFTKTGQGRLQNNKWQDCVDLGNNNHHSACADNNANQVFAFKPAP